jgi:hypothetical protein
LGCAEVEAELGRKEEKGEGKGKSFAFFKGIKQFEFKLEFELKQIINNAPTWMQQTSSHLFIFGRQIVFLFFSCNIFLVKN